MTPVRAVGRIWENFGTERPSPRGTAFAIAPRLALTAFHCVRNDDDPSEPTQNPMVLELSSDVVLAFRVVQHDPIADVALLRLDEELPAAYSFLPIAETTGFRDARFQGEGFPANVSGSSKFTVTGRLVDPEATRYGARVIQLFVEQMVKDLDPKGLSGGPVLVETATISGDRWVVVGVTRSSPINLETGDLGVAATLYGCAIDTVRELWPDEIARHVKTVDQDARDRAHHELESLRDAAWLHPGHEKAPLEEIWMDLLAARPMWHELVATNLQRLGVALQAALENDGPQALDQVRLDCLAVDVHDVYSVVRSAVRKAIAPLPEVLGREPGARPSLPSSCETSQIA